MTELITERLIMRPFTVDDLDQAYEVLEGHPDVWRFDPGHPRSREDRRELLLYRMLEYRRQGFGCLAVLLKDSSTLIGYCGLQLYLFEGERFSRPEVELFYKLGRDYWGQGYATEACLHAISDAFDRLRMSRLITWTHRENDRSLKLLQRLGMRLLPAPREPEFVIGILRNPALAQAADDGDDEIPDEDTQET